MGDNECLEPLGVPRKVRPLPVKTYVGKVATYMFKPVVKIFHLYVDELYVDDGSQVHMCTRSLSVRRVAPVSVTMTADIMYV